MQSTEGGKETILNIREKQPSSNYYPGRLGAKKGRIKGEAFR